MAVDVQIGTVLQESRFLFVAHKHVHTLSACLQPKGLTTTSR